MIHYDGIVILDCEDSSHHGLSLSSLREHLLLRDSLPLLGLIQNLIGLLPFTDSSLGGYSSTSADQRITFCIWT